MSARHEGSVESIEIDGVPWSVTVAGSGPLVVFLHGTLSDHRVFDAQVAELSRSYRCVAVDWPGHGASGFNPAGWSVSDLVDGVAALIESFGEGPAVLVGLSQGGAITLRLALARPDLVAAIVTIGAGPDGPSAEVAEHLAATGRTLAQQTFEQRLETLRSLQTMFHTPDWVGSHPQEAAAELDRMASHPIDAYPLLTRIPAQYGTVEDRLGEIEVPALIIWGVDDVRAFWGPRMVQAIPDARLAEVPDAGHHASLDNPAAISKLIGGFLDERL